MGKFPVGVGVEEGEMEREQRWDVVGRGRFECWKQGPGGDGEGFVFRVGRRGVEIEGEGEGGRGEGGK